MRESLKIVRQAMNKIPSDGPFRAEAPGIIPPSREEMKTSMEGLIYHFKIFTEGFAPPPGEVYQASNRRAANWASSWRATARRSRTA